MLSICYMVLTTKQRTQSGVTFIALYGGTTARKAAQTIQSKPTHPSFSPIRLYQVHSPFSTHLKSCRVGQHQNMLFWQGKTAGWDLKLVFNFFYSSSIYVKRIVVVLTSAYKIPLLHLQKGYRWRPMTSYPLRPQQSKERENVSNNAEIHTSPSRYHWTDLSLSIVYVFIHLCCLWSSSSP